MQGRWASSLYVKPCADSIVGIPLQVAVNEEFSLVSFEVRTIVLSPQLSGKSSPCQITVAAIIQISLGTL